MRCPPLPVPLILVAFNGCSSGDGPTGTKTLSLTVDVATVGHSQNPDGYHVRLNGSDAGLAAPDDTLFLFDLEPGEYAVELSGIAGNCHSPSALQTVAVSATEHARASFAVACDSVLKGVILFTRITTAPGGGKSEVFQIQPDGSGEQLVTEGSGATASPDGRQIVFTRSYPGLSIVRMNVDGTVPVDLTPSTTYDQCPVWSPDGGWIAFSSMRSGEWQLYLMRPDGRDQHRLTTSGRQEACGVSWSPDASRVTFGRSTVDFSGSHVVVINADGTGEQVLSAEPVDGSPAWSPDGTQIVFNSVRSGTNQIWLMQADGQSPQRLTTGPEFFYGRPLWSPEGAEVVFDRSDVNPGTLYRMGADGTNITPVTSGPTGWDQPSQWLP